VLVGFAQSQTADMICTLSDTQLRRCRRVLSEVPSAARAEMVDYATAVKLVDALILSRLSTPSIGARMQVN